MDSFSFEAPTSGNFGDTSEAESFGETENFFSVPYFQRHERGGRRKSTGKDEMRRQALAKQRKNTILENAEPESTEEAGRDKAPTKRRKIQLAPKPAPTMPKSPSFMSRKKPEIHKKTGEKSKKENLSENLSEFYKNFPKQTVDPKQKRKTTIVQPFNFMIREEKREKEKREKETRQQENLEAHSDDEITFRQPIRKRTKSRSKSMSNAVFNRLAKPRVPAKQKESLPKPEPRQKTDLAKVFAPPKEIKRKKWEPTKPITPHFRVDKRASERKVLHHKNAPESKK